MRCRGSKGRYLGPSAAARSNLAYAVGLPTCARTTAPISGSSQRLAQHRHIIRNDDTIVRPLFGRLTMAADSAQERRSAGCDALPPCATGQRLAEDRPTGADTTRSLLDRPANPISPRRPNHPHSKPRSSRRLVVTAVSMLPPVVAGAVVAAGVPVVVGVVVVWAADTPIPPSINAVARTQVLSRGNFMTFSTIGASQGDNRHPSLAVQ